MTHPLRHLLTLPLALSLPLFVLSCSGADPTDEPSSQTPSGNTEAQTTPTPGATPTATAVTTATPTPTVLVTATPTATATPTQPNVPLVGYGKLSGDCGVIDPALLAAGTSSLFENTIDFDDQTFSESLLSEDALTVYKTDNAGGSSQESEAISMDILYRCELADLIKTETEIVYDTEGSITDILVDIDAEKVGVSVTRAEAAPGEKYTLEDAERVLDKKLSGINESSANVSDADAWVKQILHVLATDSDAGAIMEQAYMTADPKDLADTIVIISVTDGNDEFIY